MPLKLKCEKELCARAGVGSNANVGDRGAMSLFGVPLVCTVPGSMASSWIDVKWIKCTYAEPAAVVCLAR